MRLLRIFSSLIFFIWLFFQAYSITPKDYEEFENQWKAAEDGRIRPSPIFSQKREGARKTWLCCNSQISPIEIYANHSKLTFIPAKTGAIFLEDMEDVVCTASHENNSFLARANHASFDYVQRELKGSHIEIEEKSPTGELISNGKALAAQMLLRDGTPKYHARKFSLHTLREDFAS